METVVHGVAEILEDSFHSLIVDACRSWVVLREFDDGI